MTSISKSHIRAIVYYEFLLGHSAAEATRNICGAFKENLVSRWTVDRCFNRFESGDISLEDHPRSGRPSECDDDALIRALEEKPYATTRELSVALACSQTTIVRHLENLGYRKVMSTWIKDPEPS